MLSIYPSLPQFWQWVILIGSVLVAFAAMWAVVRKAWPSFKAFVAALGSFVSVVNALSDLPQFMVTTAHTLADQDLKIEEIRHEVKFNNGSSVKDSITRVEAKQKTSMATQARIERGVAGLYLRMTQAEDELERTRPPIKRPAHKRPAKPKEQ